jgi:hypothetical protein
MSLGEFIKGINMFALNINEAVRFIEVMKATKPSQSFDCNYAWAVYIHSGANKKGSFEDYLKHNRDVKSWEWEQLNRFYKTK